ncbi:hypothetical protein EGM72_10775 [Staphylococcus epidermidis]|nr:hypothetical protein [Staphylococcus epidermidis]
MQYYKPYKPLLAKLNIFKEACDTNMSQASLIYSKPQHREFQYEILRTKQVGVRGPNTENFSTKFLGQSKLGF